MLLIGTAAQAASAPAVSRAELERRYREPASRFLMADGYRVHYADQGRGPAVVLLNASYFNLSSWRAVAERLAAGHRVIRLDFPGVGLTGPAPPDALSIAGYERLVVALLDRLGVRRTAVVGASSGGIVAFQLAAAHPDRVTRLVLVNAAGLPRTPLTNPLRRAPDADPGQPAFWLDSLRRNFADPARAPPEIASAMYDFSRREGAAAESAAFLKGFNTGDPQRVLAQVRAPTLILFGERGATLSHLEAEVFAYWMTGAPTFIRKYPDAGHYPFLEQPEAVAGDLERFLSGALDRDLRRTVRAPMTAKDVPLEVLR